MLTNKGILIFLTYLFSSHLSVAQKAKLVSATRQAVYPGVDMGGHYENFYVTILSNKTADFVVDSVLTKANGIKVNYNFSSAKDGKFHLGFEKTVLNPPCCGREKLPPVPPDNADYTEGVIIYYKIAGKKKKIVVSTFKEIAAIYAP